jgi:hypothetical protein
VVGVNGTNFYNWTPIPNDINNETCRIKITHNKTGFTDVNVTSVAFPIRPRINVTEPILNQTLVANSENTYRINWTYTGTSIKRVNIQYYNGSGWNPIENGVLVENGSFYVWPLTPLVTTTNAYVRVFDENNTNVTGTSPRFNLIGNLTLTNPTGGQNWAVGSTQYVEWDSAAVNFVNVSYSFYNDTDPNSVNWTVLNSSVPAGNKNTSWTIDSAENTTTIARIKIADTSNPNVVYKISNPFAIMATFDVLHPENGDTVYARRITTLTGLLMVQLSAGFVLNTRPVGAYGRTLPIQLSPIPGIISGTQYREII